MNLFDNPDTFGRPIKELSKKEKVQKARKLTNELTSNAIAWLNDTGQFIVHRQNNIPSVRVSRKIVSVPDCYDKEGNPKIVEYEEVKTSFKSNQKQFALLDISGFSVDGIHIEIEVKRGSDSLKQDQKDRIKSIKDNGGISFVFDSMETLILQMKPFLKERKPAF